MKRKQLFIEPLTELQIFMNVFVAKENEQVCSILCDTKKGYLFVERSVSSFDTIEIDDKIIKYETFIGSNDVKFPFARGEKMFIICSTKNKCLTTEKWKKQKTYLTSYLEKMWN